MLQLVGLVCTRQFRVLGSDDCPTATWLFLSEHGDEMASDEQPGTVFIFQPGLHVINSRYSSQAGEPVDSFL